MHSRAQMYVYTDNTEVKIYICIHVPLDLWSVMMMMAQETVMMVMSDDKL